MLSEAAETKKYNKRRIKKRQNGKERKKQERKHSAIRGEGNAAPASPEANIVKTR